MWSLTDQDIQPSAGAPCIKVQNMSAQPPTHPGDSSSEDEILGWTEPGRMMRNLFDLPQTPKGSDNKRKDVPSGFVKKDDGSYIQNDEDDR